MCTHTQIGVLISNVTIMYLYLVWRRVFEEPIDHLLHLKSGIWIMCMQSHTIHFIVSLSPYQCVQRRDIAPIVGYLIRVLAMGDCCVELT